MLSKLTTYVLRAIVAAAFVAPLHAQIPTPESVFGFKVGADFKLIDYDESIRYFQQLAQKSDRIKLVDVGKTSTGHAWTLAIISSPQNLARLDALTEIAQKVAHPAGLTDSAAAKLARDGRAFVDISGGLHASEIAGSQHTIQLAYDLLSRNDEQTRRILDGDVEVASGRHQIQGDPDEPRADDVRAEPRVPAQYDDAGGNFDHADDHHQGRRRDR